MSEVIGGQEEMQGHVVTNRPLAPSPEECGLSVDTLLFSRETIFMKNKFPYFKLGKIIEHFINTV